MKGKMKHHGARKRARGGSVNEYNAKGAPEMAEAKSGDDGFKKGGGVEKRKHGGKVSGAAAMKRIDKAPRHKGGHMARGGSPMSAGHNLRNRTTGGPGQGHEGDGPHDDDAGKD